MFVLGTLILPFSVALCQKSDLGLSMIAAPTYIISEKVSFLSFGQTEYLFQALIFTIMCIIVKKFKLIYLTSFLSALIYGTILDVCVFLINAQQPAEFMWQRVLLFVVGELLTALSIAFFMNTYLPPCVYDYLVRTVSQNKGFDLRKTKLINDFSYLALGTILSLVLFKGFKGVTWGTLVIAVVNGNLIGMFSNILSKHIDFYNRFPKLATKFE